MQQRFARTSPSNKILELYFVTSCFESQLLRIRICAVKWNLLLPLSNLCFFLYKDASKYSSNFSLLKTKKQDKNLNQTVKVIIYMHM